MTFYPGEVYLFGATNGGTWDYNDTWKFTAPDNKDGSFVSPAMTASGEARICVKTDVDWWRTEFTLCNGEIFYRENNPVNDSWGKDVGPEYSIQGAAGKTIRLNFTAGTGELK
jgi:agmatine/peptidylarginine deiminase